MFEQDHGPDQCLVSATGQNIEEWITLYQHQIELDARNTTAHINLGACLRLAGRHAESIQRLQMALALEPESPPALYNLATVLLETGDLTGSISLLEQTVALQPSWGLAHASLGMAFVAGDNLEDARSALRTALSLDPGCHPAVHYLKLVHTAYDETEEAMTVVREGLRHTASLCHECHLFLGLSLLQKGEYEEGWREYEWRWPPSGRIPSFEGLDRPVWDGSPLHGEAIVLWAEQGLGDILQFVRFATHVHERGGTVCILSRPNLDRILTTCPGVSRVTSRIEDVGEYDYQLPLASLPRVLGINLNDLPAARVPYLAPPMRLTSDPFGPRRGEELRIGIVWAVEPGQPNWEQRSCPLALFRALETVPGVEIYSLQFGSRSAELRQPDAPRAADLSAVLGDFANTAALVEHLDLVITVDTSLAHLAGAIGKQVWTLIPRDSDWRWLRGREDSPWYPTMRLFRQDEARQWEPVIENVKESLQALRDRLTVLN